jgi:hypothetical protein
MLLLNVAAVLFQQVAQKKKFANEAGANLPK